MSGTAAMMNPLEAFNKPLTTSSPSPGFELIMLATNWGYGGVLLSIQKQLPMVVAGVHEGKNEINARVGYFKLGINLKSERPSVLQLRKSVEEILANNVYSENVKSLSEEFNRYDPNEICVRQVARLVRYSAKPKIKEEVSIY